MVLLLQDIFRLRQKCFLIRLLGWYFGYITFYNCTVFSLYQQLFRVDESSMETQPKMDIFWRQWSLWTNTVALPCDVDVWKEETDPRFYNHL